MIVKNFKKIYYRRKWASLTVVISLIYLSTILFSIYCGVVLHKSGYSFQIKSWAKGLAQNKLDFISAYINGLLADPEHLLINIGYLDFKKLEYKRKVSLAQGILLAGPDDYVPANIMHKDKNVKVKLRLKGDLLDHLGGEKWSFRIKVKGNDTLLGMKVFSIQHPKTRYYLNEWVFHELLGFNRLPALRYDFIEVSLNGRNLGIYALEEHFDKLLLENNQMSEGPILKFDESMAFISTYIDKRSINGNELFYLYPIDCFQTNKIFQDETLKKQFNIAKNLLESFRREKLKAHQVFDMQKIAKLFAICDLFGHYHANAPSNIRFYYNPATSMLEPIGYDSENIRRISVEKLSVMNADTDIWLKLFFLDEIFVEEYIKDLEEISDKEYLDNFFSKISSEFQDKLRILHKSFPYYNFSDKEILYENQKAIKRFLNPNRVLQAYFYKITDDHITLQIGNMTRLPVEILDLAYKDSFLFEPVERTILASKPLYNPIDFQKASFRLPQDFIWQDSMTADLRLNYRIPGTGTVREETVFPWTYLDDEFTKKDFASQPPNMREFNFLTVDDAAGRISIKQGVWDIKQDLIMPDGYVIIGREGTKLNLSNSAKILSYSPLEFIGTREDPMVIHSADSTGRGIAVMDSGKKSVLKYVVFNNLSSSSQNGRKLTGAVTFYKSPVDIVRCRFINNKAEDSLNIIRSSFMVYKTSFDHSFSDAFDSDFSKGEIIRSSFADCGNDAINISGSLVDMRGVSIDGTGGKGISVGEESKVKSKNIDIKNTKIGIASKDMSRVDIGNATISDCEVGLAVYQKKPGYNPASIRADEVTMNKVGIPYLVEEGSELNIKEKSVKTDQERTRKLLNKYVNYE